MARCVSCDLKKRFEQLNKYGYCAPCWSVPRINFIRETGRSRKVKGE